MQGVHWFPEDGGPQGPLAPISNLDALLRVTASFGSDTTIRGGYLAGPEVPELLPFPGFSVLLPSTV